MEFDEIDNNKKEELDSINYFESLVFPAISSEKTSDEPHKKEKNSSSGISSVSLLSSSSINLDKDNKNNDDIDKENTNKSSVESDFSSTQKKNSDNLRSSSSKSSKIEWSPLNQSGDDLSSDTQSKDVRTKSSRPTEDRDMAKSQSSQNSSSKKHNESDKKNKSTRSLRSSQSSNASKLIDSSNALESSKISKASASRSSSADTPREKKLRTVTSSFKTVSSQSSKDSDSSKGSKSSSSPTSEKRTPRTSSSNPIVSSSRSSRSGNGSNKKSSQGRSVSSSGQFPVQKKSASSTGSSSATGRRTGSADRSSMGRSSMGRSSKNKDYDVANSNIYNNNSSKNGKTQKPKKQKKHRAWWIILLILLSIFLCGAGAFAYLYITIKVPAPSDVALAQRTSVYYSNDTKIGDYGGENREIIGCDALPSYVGNAVVSSENQSFWTDSGVNIKGIIRAFLNNVSGGARQGASTITQQYAKNYYMDRATTYMGKLRQAILAMKITQTQSKQTILCNYLNTIYFGRGAYGIQAAAQTYFGVPAKDLTVSQSALLAGIIPAPSLWDPAIMPEQARKRYDRTIKLMLEDHHITQTQYDHASFPQTRPLEADANTYGGTRGYILQMVKTELIRQKTFTDAQIQGGGYKIITTLKPKEQEIMQKVGESRTPNAPSTLRQGGITINPQTGAITSIYAGSNYLKRPLNNATEAQYEPGSTMKPFTLLASIQKGLSPETTYNGKSPQYFKGLEKPVGNFENEQYGNINLYQAMADSVNTVFMRLNEEVTPEATARVAHEAGITQPISNDSPFNVLGINSVTPLDMCRAQATLADGGIRRTPHIVEKVIGPDGNVLYTANTGGQRVFSANNTALTLAVMRQVVLHGTGREASSLPWQIAGKTGTANDGKAVSFVGLTPNTATVFAVWNEGPGGKPLVLPNYFGPYLGSLYAVHLFTVYARQAFAGMNIQPLPPAVDDGAIGGPSGKWGTGNGSPLWAVPNSPLTAPPTPAPSQNQNQSENNSDTNSSDTDSSSSSSSDSNSSSSNSSSTNTTKNKKQSQNNGNSSNSGPPTSSGGSPPDNNSDDST